MTDEHFDGFVDSLLMFMVIYDKAISDELYPLWFGALKEFPLEEIQASFNACIRDTKVGRFKPPMPADILEHMPVTNASLAREAWTVIYRALRFERSRVNANAFHDPITTQVVKAMTIEKLTSFVYEEELDALGIEFKAAYVKVLQDAADKAKLPRKSDLTTKLLPKS
jgi:hypothetical protein